ncbi:hypothetical protein Cni_G10079 [Canna indica]|uniref:Uncharacterized protein n=1 Tax=Canna indica TaxID=4628 RepID=A0AAQ3QA07_9LILI|nr:hypothetical protein Cni_G10079 [Canna indica]
MGPAMYPPATPSNYNPYGIGSSSLPIINSRVNGLRGGYSKQHDEKFMLPSAQSNTGAILVLPEQLGQYSDVISRWESITLNLVNEKNWTDNKAKMCFIENLLGETEKEIWIQWRMAYPTEYDELTNIADDPQNVLSQIRRMLLLEDPTTGSTEEQNRAYEDLERLSCANVKDLFDYQNDYKILAAKSGRISDDDYGLDVEDHPGVVDPCCGDLYCSYKGIRHGLPLHVLALHVRLLRRTQISTPPCSICMNADMDNHFMIWVLNIIERAPPESINGLKTQGSGLKMNCAEVAYRREQIATVILTVCFAGCGGNRRSSLPYI